MEQVSEDTYWPIPMAARPKAWIYGRLHVGIVGSRPAEVMDIRLL